LGNTPTYYKITQTRNSFVFLATAFLRYMTDYGREDS